MYTLNVQSWRVTESTNVLFFFAQETHWWSQEKVLEEIRVLNSLAVRMGVQQTFLKQDTGGSVGQTFSPSFLT